MKRLVVLGVVASLSNATAAFAEGSLLASASRITQQIVLDQPQTPSKPVATSTGRTLKGQKPASAAQQGGTSAPAVSTSGMSKSKKFLIAIAAGVGFAAAVYTIDHDVLDVTPSSLGTRQD